MKYNLFIQDEDEDEDEGVVAPVPEPVPEPKPVYRIPKLPSKSPPSAKANQKSPSKRLTQSTISSAGKLTIPKVSYFSTL